MSAMEGVKILADVASELSGLSSAARLGKRYIPSRTRAKLTHMVPHRRSKKAKSGPPRKSYNARTKEFGDDLHGENAKRYQVTNTNLSLVNGKTLYLQELTNIPKTTTNLTDERQRHVINMRGAKICFEVLSKWSTTNAPIYFHVAVVSPKGQQVGVTATNFFRGNGATRGVDADSNLSSLQWNCLPINADNYTVLHHDKMMLGSSESSGTGEFKDPMRPNYMRYDKWVKINRQIRYMGNASTDCQHPVYVVYWFDWFGRPGGSSGTALLGDDIAEISEHHVTYFKETQTCC